MSSSTTAKRSVAHVPTSAFVHPLDRDALAALQAFPGFDEAARAFMKHTLDKPLHVLNVASRVRVGERQFKDLYDTFVDCATRAGVSPIPPLYVGNGEINAFTSGVDSPFVVISSGAVSKCTKAELETIFAHELAHIRCEHVLYRQLASYLPILIERVPMVGPLLRFGLEFTLLEWARKAEFSCDRLGLLVSQDLEAACRSMMKIAGAPSVYYEELNVDAFLEQYKDYVELDSDNLSFAYKLLSTTRMSHPWSVVRAAELHKWVASGEYDRLLNSEPGSFDVAPTVEIVSDGPAEPGKGTEQVREPLNAAAMEQAVGEAVREGSKKVKDFLKKFV